MPQVAVFMGSLSDLDVVRPCVEQLAALGVTYYFTVSSAHRTPDRTNELVRAMESEGCQVYICAAGMAAHLAGAVAARTLKPVVGIPVAASALGGLDALLSTVMMPPGFPVATMALDKAGARNAAWMAAQILALSDAALADRIQAARDKFAADVEQAAQSLQQTQASTDTLQG